MIPYFEWTTIHIGPFTLYVWGIFVALGFLLGGWMAAFFARKQGLKPKIIWDLLFWIMIAGVIGARLGYVFFYDATDVLSRPAEIFAIWNGGMSIFGGIVLAVLAAILYMRKMQLNVWKYTDAAIFGLPVGLWIGRIGCFLIHDHPGTATDFFLGVEYPDGTVRHDHGLYLSINGLVLAGLFLWLARKKRPIGTYISVFLVWYGVVRFFLDFYRVFEVKYLGLTPGQYIAAVFFAIGVWVFVKVKGDENSYWQPINLRKD